MKTTKRSSAESQSTRLPLTTAQHRILYQVMHHVQESSHYGFGDVFWVKGPSIDTLALELGKFPHQIIDDVNALIRFGFVVMDCYSDNPSYSNFVCVPHDGWRQHPNFEKLLPWIADEEQWQDWQWEPEFEGMSDEDLDAFGVKEKDETWLSLPGVTDVFSDSALEDNAELRSDYIVRPTAKRLGGLAEQVSRRSTITCVIPESGACRFMTVAHLFRDLGKLKDGRLRVTITRSVKDSPYEKTSELDIESAYIHNRRLYYVLDYEGRSLI